MKKILLSHNEKVLLIDDEDYELVRTLNLHIQKNERRVYVFYKGKTTSLARVLVDVPSHLEIDHINHNPLDNRRKNLRTCSRLQNEANKPPGKNNTSGYKGVYWEKKEMKWVARIKENRKNIRLGSFKSKVKAAKAYNEAAKRIHGEFAWLNPV